jgi:hypothetical protein
MDAFWIDTEYSGGITRYGAYVRQGSFEPYSDNDRAVELAVYAWERGTGPVMSPPYVCRHRRVHRAQLARSDWDGSLLARVDLVISQPSPLRWMRTDEERGYWRDWPVDQHAVRRADEAPFYEPDSDELASDHYLLCTASLRFTVPSAGLPQPHPDGADVETCQRAVAVVVRELNAIVAPVLRQIEES